MTDQTTNWVERFGSVGKAIDAAEAIAARLLAEEADSGPEWAIGYITKVRHEAHMGDCAKARWWDQAPMTCAACVYDEMMERAWKELSRG